MVIAYNPLDLANLAETVQRKFDEQKLTNLSKLERLEGAGVYALYYAGDFSLYKSMSRVNRRKRGSKAIYVGEAGRQARRKGAELNRKETAAIYARLRQHAESIEAVKNLRVEDFWFRYLPIESLFVPLCERMLISTHKPLWNLHLEGFGNRVVGKERTRQQITPWDLLHPGREKRATQKNKRFPTKALLEEYIKKALAEERSD